MKERIQQYTFGAGGKEAVLCTAAEPDRPLIVLNSYTSGADPVLSAVRELGGADFSLLSISGLDWNRDMAPWDCQPLSEGDVPFTGGADDYLGLLLSELLPGALKLISGTPVHIGITGYSLAGLFALYALYRCDAFDRAASMSGSLWFPGFKDYVFSHEMRKKPERIYLSLGDKEDRTRNPLMKTIREDTEGITAHYREAGLDVVWELNRGDHFKNPPRRIAKGILAIL